MKGHIEPYMEGYRCTCPGTWTGYGVTPEAAWFAWVEALRLSRQPGDVYDQTERDYRELDGHD